MDQNQTKNSINCQIVLFILNSKTTRTYFDEFSTVHCFVSAYCRAGDCVFFMVSVCQGHYNQCTLQKIHTFTSVEFTAHTYRFLSDVYIHIEEAFSISRESIEIFSMTAVESLLFFHTNCNPYHVQLKRSIKLKRLTFKNNNITSEQKYRMENKKENYRRTCELHNTRSGVVLM